VEFERNSEDDIIQENHSIFCMKNELKSREGQEQNRERFALEPVAIKDYLNEMLLL
jgi:hypothetical protein